MQSRAFAITLTEVVRLGLLDISVLVLLVIALFLPPREIRVEPLYAAANPELLSELDWAQAEVLRSPGDGAAAARLADVLTRLGLHHDAMRVAGDAADAKQGWRASLAVSAAHAERLDVRQAFDWVNRAIEACGGEGCPEHERLRMEIYAATLERGLDSEIDPREYPEQFRQETMKAFRRSKRQER